MNYHVHIRYKQEDKNMKSNTKQVRDAVKNLIIEKGANNILNLHITEVVEKIGCTYCDVQNAMSYFRYSPQQAKFRECYF
jgi:hypothetical protein|nr:MAG TPA: hypothetical protein [Caudoviricetes sp.]